MPLFFRFLFITFKPINGFLKFKNINAWNYEEFLNRQRMRHFWYLPDIRKRRPGHVKNHYFKKNFFFENFLRKNANLKWNFFIFLVEILEKHSWRKPRIQVQNGSTKTFFLNSFIEFKTSISGAHFFLKNSWRKKFSQIWFRICPIKAKNSTFHI